MSIAAHALSKRYAEVVAAGTIGGADEWRNLASLAFACIKRNEPEQKVVAYGLYAVFSDLWRMYDERPVASSETRQLVALAHQPIQRCIDFLEHNMATDDALTVLSPLIDLIMDQSY